MANEKYSIEYGSSSITYHVHRVARKTMEIAVHPNMQVVVRAPLEASEGAIQQKVILRKKWVARQLRYFEQFHPRTPDRKYINGETHLYLGRQYRVKAVKSDQRKTTLKNGYLVVEVLGVHPLEIKMALEEWYRIKARAYFSKVVENHANSFKEMGYATPRLVVRHMQSRWGSLSADGQLTLNPRLIQAPRSSIEYVIVHELCHLIEHSHSGKFYSVLEEMLPDWQERKNKLEVSLA